MNKHAIIPLVIGLVVGIAALKIGYDYLAKMKKQGGPDLGPVQKAVVAGKNLPLGTKLTDKDIVAVYLPVKCLPEGAIKDSKEVIGQTLQLSLLAKMPIIKSMVGPGEGLEGVIPYGFRAVSVKVDEFTSVGGLLKPGVKVDVLGTFTLKKSSGGNITVSKTILQNVEVRAVGQQFKPDTGVTDAATSKPKVQARSVTLLVKSDQAEALQLAASSGSLRLALRSAVDDKQANTKGITLSQLIAPDFMGAGAGGGTFGNSIALALYGKSSATAGTINPDEPYMVEVINGGKMEQLYFASPESDKRVDAKKDGKSDPEPVQAQGE